MKKREIHELIDSNRLPQSFKSMNWIKEHLLIKAGYSLNDINQMSSERFDYLIYYLTQVKKAGKGNPFEGGL